MHKLAAGLFALTAALLAAPQAHATLTPSGSPGGAPLSLASYENFDGLALGAGGGELASGVVVSFSPDGAAVQGAMAGLYAPPFLSGGNGVGFGTQPNGADATTYLTSGSTGAVSGASVTIKLPFDALYIGLLWGSIDAYNTLTFFNAADVNVGSLTGSQVLAGANGDQGVGGTLYVNINSTLAFNRVVATSTSYAFELDNIAFNPTRVPEPLTLSILGTGLLGLGMIRRKRA